MESLSRDMQDQFFINILKHKIGGFYLEIGANHYKDGNNFYLLEQKYDWQGISLEIDTKWKKEWLENRKNPCIYKNALEVDYLDLLKDMPKVIDALQLDCEPPMVTYNILRRIPFDQYKFRVITFEHDQYNTKPGTEDWHVKAKSRAWLESKGYVLIADNLSCKGYSDRPWEDWWVKRDLIDETMFKRWKQVDGKNKECEAYVTSKINARKIIFENDQAIGDAMVMSCGVRDFKLLFPEIEIDIRTNFDFIFNGNPYITKLDINGRDVEHYKIVYPLINRHGIGWSSYSSAFLFDMIAQVDLHERLPISAGELSSVMSKGMIGHRLYDDKKFNEALKHSEGFYKKFLTTNETNFKKNEERFREVGRVGLKLQPDIHLSEEQKDKESFIKKHNLPENYWVVAAGGKHDCTAKIWDWRRMQQVIDHFKGRVTFVQMGQSKDCIQYTVPLHGDNLVNGIDKFKVNELLPLVYHSQGCISQVSFLLHAAGAFDKPCVSIYGGREPINFACYMQQQLHSIGLLDCCKADGCWKNLIEECENVVEIDGRQVQKCMDLIKAEDVIRCIEVYLS